MRDSKILMLPQLPYKCAHDRCLHFPKPYLANSENFSCAWTSLLKIVRLTELISQQAELEVRYVQSRDSSSSSSVSSVAGAKELLTTCALRADS
jgi:hypothetical protein